MMKNHKSDYIGKCGACKYFNFNFRNGDTRSDGKCERLDRTRYHQASQPACKKYKEDEEDE